MHIEGKQSSIISVQRQEEKLYHVQEPTTAISSLCCSYMQFCYQPAEGSQETYQPARLFENFQPASS